MPESKTKKSKRSSVFSFDDYDNVIGFVVSQAAYRLGKTLSRAIRGVGSDLTPHEFALLNRVHQYKKLSQSALAELTYKDEPRMSRMIDRLIEKGLVVKKPSGEDRRAFQVSLSAAGRALRERIVPLAAGNLLKACEGIPKEKLLVTVETLRLLTLHLVDGP